MQWFLEAAGLGNTLAQFNAGLLLQGQFGLPADLPQSVHWLELAASKGHQQAIILLASTLASDDPKVQNYPKAMAWFQTAVEQNNPIACYNLGVLYENGQGREADPQTAAEWYKKAAIQGHAAAQVSLARILDSQEVYPQPKEAFHWYQQAARQGQPEALAALGTYYVHGHFVPQDIDQARSLFKAAAQKGNEKASIFLKILDEPLADNSKKQQSPRKANTSLTNQ